MRTTPCNRFFAWLAAGLAAFAATATLKCSTLIYPQKLQELKAAPTESWLGQARETLLKQADKTLRENQTYSVQSNDHIPPSGDKADYYSIGPYWWPDPTKENGLPYINKDGQLNPESRQNTDTKPLANLCQDARLAILAYALTNEESYAAHAAKLLRLFFLEEDSKMNPNLNFAQGVPGLSNGRCFGIIEGMPFAGLVEALPLLRGSASYTSDLESGLVAWFAQYHDWLTSDPLGIEESERENNHAVTYDVQALCIAGFLGRDSWSKAWLTRRSLPRIDQQITPSGGMPRELARTKSWNYTTMNLTHFFELALIAKRHGLDFFQEPSLEAPRIKAALDYALPYVDAPEQWPHKQIQKWDATKLRYALAIASATYPSAAYDAARERLGWTMPPAEEYIALP